MSKNWHITQSAGRVTLSRHLPPRFDFAVHTHLPQGNPRRLAHQIRQDLWRALQRVRGFSPVVQLDQTPEGWAVTAGGRVLGKIAPATQAKASAVLQHAGHRARWGRHAGGAS
mmetsp:Transcript_27766/g.51722  ORF Transcript_27766/g.51722 Transcript_27766/m.51722 type:complete len:113 (-) Transcript_27766:1263-1601(-)